MRTTTRRSWLSKAALVSAVASALLSCSMACGSNARHDAAASSAPSASVAQASASGDTRTAGTATATSSAPIATTSSAAADVPPLPFKCGDGRFEHVGTFHTGPELHAPTSRSQLPAPFPWRACNGGPADCSELDLGAGGADANGFALDLGTPRGPLLIVTGGIALCTYVLSIDLDGNVQTAMELRDPSAAMLGNLAVGQGAYMVHVSVTHIGEIAKSGWLIGSSATPPATRLAEEGEGTNDAISDRLWYDAKKGAFGTLGSATAKGKFDKVPSAYAVVHGSVLALHDDHAKITVRSGSDETDVVVPDAGHRVVGFDASPNLLAWVESSDTECVLRTSPFALTPLGRSTPLKPKELAKVPCDGAGSVAIERGWILAGNEIIKLADSKRVPIASTVCAADAKPKCVRESVLGVTETHIYFSPGDKIRRVPIASIAP